MIAQVKQNIEEKIRGKVVYDEPMRKHTSFCIGGPADIWIEPQDTGDLKNCIQLSKDNDIPLFVIGGGTNILVNDEGIRGVVVNMLAPSLKNIFWGNRKVDVTSSVTLGEFLKFSSDKGLGGLEFLSGIPGTIGGAAMTNAGARDYEETEKWYNIGDFIEAIKILNYDGMTELLSKRDFSFGYKTLDIKDCIILEVKFLLNKVKKEDVARNCRGFLKRKKETQELSLPSAGCIFKNPAGGDKSAGRLIDECGLKGAKIGGAAFSRKHANFIVNTGGARASDVKALMDLARERVKDKFGVDLSPEIKIV